MDKRRIKSEEEFQVKVLPEANDVIGIARKMLGGDRLLVSCQGGKERLCRIPREDEEKNVNTDGGHLFGLAMGFPVRQAR